MAPTVPPALLARRLQSPHNGFLNEGADGTVVLLPKGVYKVTQALEISQSNVVFRGTGVSGWAAAGWPGCVRLALLAPRGTRR